MKKILLLLLLLTVTYPVYGQTSITGTVMEGPSTVRPLSCASGDLFFAQDTFIFYQCGPTNTWDSIGGGSGQFGYASASSTSNITLNSQTNFFYDFNLVGNVASMNVTNVGQIPGTIYGVQFCQPTSGGTYNYTVAWPLNFNSPPSVLSGIGQCSSMLFKLNSSGTWDATVRSNYEVVEFNSVAVPQQAVTNILSPLTVNNNTSNNSTDIGIATFVGAGATHARGAVPDPGSTPHNLPLCDTGAFSATCQGGGGGGGGTTVQNPLTSSGLSNSAFPLQINGDTTFQGINPYIDIRAYGARAFNPNIQPNVPGTTVTISAGSTSATVSAAQFQNGDGITIYQGGVNRSLATPTAPSVQPSLAASMAGTGVDVNAPSQSTTWYYKLVGVDKGRGMSPASAAGSTAVGAATLGPHTISITGSSSSTNFVTITTAARSPEVLAPGMTIGIETASGSPQNFEVVYDVPSNTTFRFFTGNDTRGGQVTHNYTGGSLNYWNSNTLSLPSPPTNVVQYIIYRSTDGVNYSPVHLTYPISNAALATEPTFLIWDDYGSTMSGNETFPYWVPSTPPSTTVPDSLTTTVASGGGTTSLTLAASATTAVSGGTVLLDACPGMQGAFSASGANFNGMVYIPASGQFTVNSFCELGAVERVGVLMAGQLVLNDTLRVSTSSWHGLPSNQTVTAFGLAPGSFISVPRANPGIWVDASNETFWDDFFISGGSNGYVLMFVDGGTLPTGIFNNLSFQGGNVNDRTGVDLYMSGGTAGDAPSGFQIHNLTAGTNSPQVGSGGWGVTATPAVIIKNLGEFTIDGVYLSSTGLWVKPAAAGISLTIDNKYEMQGGAMPWLTTYFTGGIVGGFVDIKKPIQDTSFVCTVFNSATIGDFAPMVQLDYPFPAPNADVTCGNPFVSFTTQSIGGSDSGGQSVNTEKNTWGTAIDGTISTNVGFATAVKRFSKEVEIAGPYSIHSANPIFAQACTAVASGAGTFNGTASFSVVPVYPDNGEGYTLATCSVSGLTNNGVALSWSSTPSAIGYDVYFGGTLANLNSCAVPQVTGTSVTITTGAFTCGPSQPQIAGSGPSGLSQNKMWAPTIAITKPGSVPPGITGETVVYTDPTVSWLTMKPNGNAAYLMLGLTGSHTAGQTGCFSDNTTGAMTACNNGGGTANYQLMEQNSVALPAEPIFNCISPLTCADNPASTRTDMSIPVFVSAGGSHASGLVPDPGAAVHNYPLCDTGSFSTTCQGTGAIVKPDPASGIQYVAVTCAGTVACSDSNDGLSLGTAKATITAALCTLPNGNCGSSPQKTGNGTVYFVDGVKANSNSNVGIWVAGSADSQYGSLPAGWMQSSLNGNFNLICMSLFTVVAHGNKPSCTVNGPTFSSGSGNLPLFWLSGTTAPIYVYGLSSASGSPKWGNIGVDSSGATVTTGGTQVVSVTIENVFSNFPSGAFAGGRGPQLTVGNGFWLHVRDSSFAGNLGETGSISTIARSSGTVTVTMLNPCPFVTGDHISITGVTEGTLNGTFTATAGCSGGSSFTFSQGGPAVSSSGGTAASDRAFAIVLNGSQIEMNRMHEENGGGIKFYPISNGSLQLNDIYMEGFGTGTMPILWTSSALGSGGGSVDMGGAFMSDTPTNPLYINEANSAIFAHTSFSQSTTSQGFGIMVNGGDASVRTTDYLASGQTGWLGGQYFESQNDIGRRAGGPTSVNFVNYASQTPAGWSNSASGASGSGYTTIAGKTDPFGGTGAYEIDSAGGSVGVTLFLDLGAFPVAVNDTYYFGAWVRAVNGSFSSMRVPLQFSLTGLGNGGGNLCYGGQAQAIASTPFVGDGNWFWATGSCKLWTHTAVNDYIGFGVILDTAHPVQVYRPWFIRIPAGAISNTEIADEINSVTTGYSISAAAGDVAFAPSQRLCIPSGSATNEFCAYLVHNDTANRTYTLQDASGTIPTFTGTPTNNNCVKWVLTGSVYTLGDAGAACGAGGGGSGTVSSGLLNSLAFYTATGTTVGPLNGPTTPANVPQYIVYNPNGSVSGPPAPALAGVPGRPNSSNNDNVVAGDRNNWITESFAGNVTANISQTIFGSNFAFKMTAYGANSNVSVTPSGGTCNGASSCTLLRGESGIFASIDNLNLIADIHEPPIVCTNGVVCTRGDYTLTLSAPGAGNVFTNTTNTFTSGGTIDGSAMATTAGMKVPVGAGAVPTADGAIANNSTNHTTVVGSNGTTDVLAVAATGTGTATTCTNQVITAVSGIAVPTCSTITNAMLTTGTTVNNVAITLGSNSDLASGTGQAHGVLIYEGVSTHPNATNAMASNAVLAGAGASADPAGKSLGDLSSSDTATDTGVALNTLLACPSPSISSNGNGISVWVKPNATTSPNTATNPSLNICSVGAQTITRFGTGALVAGDIVNGVWQHFISDGTHWQLINPQTATGSGGTSAWSSLTNATGALTLSNAGNATEFDQTSAVNWTWKNTTAATSGTAQNSPQFVFGGNYWNGSAGALDSWTVGSAVASGTNGASTFTLSHTAGSTGLASVSVPSLQLGTSSTPSAITVGYTNAAGGTTNGLIAKLNGTSNTVVSVATSDTEAVGIVQSGGGTSGTAQVAVSGAVACTFDNTATAGHYVQISPSTASNCRDVGSGVPTSGSIILGRVIDGGAAGSHQVALAITPPGSTGGGIPKYPYQLAIAVAQGSGVSIGGSGAASTLPGVTLLAGSSTVPQVGAQVYAAGSTGSQYVDYSIILPITSFTTIDSVTFKVSNDTDTTVAHNDVMFFQYKCFVDGATEQPTYATAQTATGSVPSVAGNTVTLTLTSPTITGCSAGNVMFIRIGSSASSTFTGNLLLYQVKLEAH